MDEDKGEWLAMAKTDRRVEEIELCSGVMLSGSFFDKKENRLFTILLKGFMVYLVSMGSIGFYLSAFEIEYNKLFCHMVIFVMAIICALLYYRLAVENIGYLLLLGLFGLSVMSYKTIINSGFYAIVNITVEKAAIYFNQPYQKIYTEQIDDRYLTVTYVVLFIGIVLDVLMNVYISRRMQYVTAIFIVMGLNMIPLYLVEEPDNFYVIMFLIGISMTYVYKSGKHFGKQVSNKRNDYVFEKNKKEIAYKSDFKTMVQGGIIVATFVFTCVTAVTAFKPKETFNTGYTTNKYKEVTMSAVSTVLLDGWSALFRRHTDIGGLKSGQLGTVSSIKLDHKTDLQMEFTPYSFDNIYLRSFVGADYNPYENNWTRADSSEYSYVPETEALVNAYENGNEYAARGLMRITYIDVSRLDYLPYYTETYTDNLDMRDIVYYPRIEGNNAVIDTETYPDYYEDMERYLYVSPYNLEAVTRVSDELGLMDMKTDEEKIQAVIEYFRDNIPYTVKPGKTPKDEDFVNYFLLDNQKGYCAHFASAATLIFRYAGIPARYVEGYMVDYYQMTEGELVEDASYSDYYDGYSALGETALIQIDITDADAHAWVEVYDEEKGWYVVEVTPAGEMEDVEDFWDIYDEFSSNNSLGGDIAEGARDFLSFRVSNETVKKIYKVIGAFILGVLALFLTIRITKGMVFLIKLKRATINDKLILKYSLRCRRVRRYSKSFAKCVNYREQVEYFDDQREDIIAILEKAGFSDTAISPEEYEKATEWIKQNVKLHIRKAKSEVVVEE